MQWTAITVRKTNFVLPAWIEPASFRMRKTWLERGADERFDLGARVLYIYPNHVVRIDFDSGARMLESWVNK